MFTYGSQVNPSLGRQDFSSILQGAQARAQGQIQAAQAQAQMYANIGSTIGNAIQTFAQKQAEKQQQKAGSEFVSNWFKNNPDLATSFKLPTDDKGQPDPKAINAVIESLGGLKTAIPSLMAMGEFSAQNKMRRLQLGEMERSLAEQERMRQALSTPPAASAILSGARFEQLPTGKGAFSQAPSGVEDLLSRFQAAGVSPALYAQPALQLAQVQETLAQARERERGKPVVTGAFSTFEEANKEINRLTKEGAFGEDTIGTVKFENGKFVIESSLRQPRQVPDLEAAERIRLSGKLMDADIANGEQARRLLPQTNRMIQSLKSGMKTGKFEAAKAELTSYAKSFGFKVDEEALAEKEQFQAYATQQILGFFQLTKGAVSNKENELYALMGPGYSRSERANELLLEVIQERQKLDAAIGDNALRAIEEGWSPAKTAQERRKLIQAYDAKLPDPQKLGVTQISGEMPVLPQSPSGGLSPSTRALIPSR